MITGTGLIIRHEEDHQKFGSGLFNKKEVSTMHMAYLRTSVWREEKVSIEAQQAMIQERVGSKEPIQWFTDKGFSGAINKRPAFEELQGLIKSSKQPRTLYVSRYDRIARNVRDALNFLELCQTHNVEVVSVLEPIPASLGDKKSAQLLFVQILFSLAEFTRSVIIENIINGLAQKKVKKKLLSVKAPFGFRLEKGKLVPDGENAKVVSCIFHWYTTTTMGYKKIASRLNQQSATFNGRQFTSRHIAQIVANPVYMGVVGHKSNQLTAYNSSDITPIISKESFQLAVKKRKSRTPITQGMRDYPLRKKLNCPCCGKKLSPKSQINRQQGKVYHYYCCYNDACKIFSVNAEKTEATVLKLVSHYLSREEHVQLLIGAIERQLKEMNQANHHSFIAVKQQKEKVFSQFEAGELSGEQLKQQLDELADEADANSVTDISKEELTQRLATILTLTETASQELIWSYVEQVTLTKEKKVMEVIIYGIRIESTVS